MVRALTSYLVEPVSKPALATFDLLDIVTSVEADVSSDLGAGVRLRVDVPSGTCPVYGERDELRHALSNLVLNARDAIRLEGSIEVRVDLWSRYVFLSVSDDGQGMDRRTMSRIFEPFFSTKPLGTAMGWGLNDVASAVERAHGRIEVRSAPGMGSRFRLRLWRAPLRS